MGEQQAIDREGTESKEGSQQGRRLSRVRLLWGILAITLVALLVVGAWILTTGAWRGWGAVATVDGTRITRTELEEHLAFLVKQRQLQPNTVADPSRRKDVERLALNDLIAWRILLAEADRIKIKVAPGEEELAFGSAHGAQPGASKLSEAAMKMGVEVAQMREEIRRQLMMTRLVEKIGEGVTVSDEDVAKYYETNKKDITGPSMARLRILIVDSREEAEQLRGQALKGAEFEALVRQHSKGGAKDRGGDMGWVDPRVLPPVIAKAVETITGTGMTPVVEASGKFYVVRVEGRQAPRQLTLDEVKDQLRQRLMTERKRGRFMEWFEERRRSARVEINL